MLRVRQVYFPFSPDRSFSGTVLVESHKHSVKQNLDILKVLLFFIFLLIRVTFKLNLIFRKPSLLDTDQVRF